jgi:hypothetical protein
VLCFGKELSLDGWVRVGWVVVLSGCREWWWPGDRVDSCGGGSPALCLRLNVPAVPRGRCMVNPPWVSWKVPVWMVTVG